MLNKILLLAALAVLPASARERSAAEMIDAASEVLVQHHAARIGAAATSQNLRVLQRRDAFSVIGCADGGYAFISHDDRIPAVLGYSDEVYNPVGTNPVLLDYLADLEGYINFCLENDREFRVIRRAGGTQGSVGPLVTTKWDQGSPFNAYCPKVGMASCVTGCVATAAAQVLNYHQLPKTMHGRKIYSYTNQNEGRTRIVYDYGKYTIDWDHMLDYYGGSVNPTYNYAVARLMYTCGVNSSMKYTTSESGSFTYTEADGINWFMDGVRADYYSLSGKEQLVYDELDAGRPLIYSGNDGKGGHAFVIDGYNEEGLLHCNLGWSGAGNNYYLMTDMAGYKNGQGIVTVYPSEEPYYVGTPGADMPLGKVTVSSTPAEELIPDTQWYVMYNVGRSCHPFTQGKGGKIMNTCYLPVDDDPEMAAPHIVRFVTSTNANKPGYFIQSGEGWYYGSLMQGGNKGTTSTKTCNYKFGVIKPGYYWLRDEKNGLSMDSNDAGAELVGYGDSRPTDTLSNASWQFYPVTFEVPEGIHAAPVDEAPVLSTQLHDLQGRAATKPRSGQIYINGRRKVMK